MKQLHIWALGLGAGLLLAGTAGAALGMARWDYYRSDLIRCVDAADFGVNACGTDNVGDDPLKSGRVTVSKQEITAQLSRAEPEELYFVDFVPLANTGSDPDGSYEAGERRFLGAISTNRVGNGILRTENQLFFGIVGPQLGYFVFSTFDFEDMPIVDSMSMEEVDELRAAQFEGEERQFVSGFDPDFASFDFPFPVGS